MPALSARECAKLIVQALQTKTFASIQRARLPQPPSERIAGESTRDKEYVERFRDGLLLVWKKRPSRGSRQPSEEIDHVAPLHRQPETRVFARVLRLTHAGATDLCDAYEGLRAAQQ
jgi:hypothetical protein